MTPTDIDDLIERLRHGPDGLGALHEDCIKAADALTAAQARIAALESELSEWKQELLESSDPRYWYHKRKEAEARIAALEAERDGLAKDAARYRWLREKLVYQKSGPHYGWTLDELIPGDERDAAIDAAKEKP